MRMVMKSIVVFVSAWLSIVIFSPKKELYDYAKSRLEKSGIVIFDKKITENAIGIAIEQAEISNRKKKILSLEDVKIRTSLFYTPIRIKNLKFSPGNRLPPIALTRVKAYYFPWDPFEICFTGEGAPGKISGELDLKKRAISLHYAGRESRLGALRVYFKKDKEGWSFEYKF